MHQASFTRKPRVAIEFKGIFFHRKKKPEKKITEYLIKEAEETEATEDEKETQDDTDNQSTSGSGSDNQEEVVSDHSVWSGNPKFNECFDPSLEFELYSKL